MAKYKKRKDGRYATTVTVSYDADGRRKQRTIYGKTIRELDDKLAEIKSQLNRGIIIDDKGLTFGEWAETWYKTYKEPTIGYNRKRLYNTVFNHLKSSNVWGMRLNRVKRHDLQTIINSLAPTIAAETRHAMQAIISAAIDEQYIFMDVGRGLKDPAHTPKERRALTSGEITRLMAADIEPANRAYAMLMLGCGLRRGEALTLTWDDIYDGFVHVNKTILIMGGAGIVKPHPKTDAGVRKVPLPVVVEKTLAAVPRSSKSVLHDDGRFTSYYIDKLWDDVAAAADLPDDVTPHTLRHTYATKLFYSGVDIKTAQRLLGHNDIETTLDIYVHCQDIDQDTVDLIKKLF